MKSVGSLQQFTRNHATQFSASNQQVGILIVERCKVVRSAIHRMVKDFSCVGSVIEVDCPVKSKAILKEVSPNVLFINLSNSISIMECLELVKFTKKHYPHLGIVALLTHVTPELVHLLIKKGVHGILDYEATEQDFERAIQASASGNVFLSWHIYEQVLLVDKISQLTASEMQALGFLMQGDTNHTIAQKLHVTIKTVEAHLTRIYRKLDVTSRAQAIIRAQELHLFSDTMITT